MRISSTEFNNRGVNAILDQQGTLSKTQLQLALQKRVITPSDDPVASTLIEAFRNDLAVLDRYKTNSQTADSYLVEEEASLNQANNLLDRVRELILRGGNGIYGNAEREAIAVEMEQRLGELMGIANKRNASGEYIFSGHLTQVTPFTRLPDGSFSYQGDQGQRALKTSAEVDVPISDSGFDVFVNLREGNGRFAIVPGANTGTATIDPGSVVNEAQFAAASFPLTITITTNSAGVTAYKIADSGGAWLVPSPVPPLNQDLNAPAYVPDAAINVGGISTRITGTPQPGDTFVLSRSQPQDLLSTVNTALVALRSGASTPADHARLKIALDQSLVALDLGMDNINRISAKIGARLNTVDSELAANEALRVTGKTALSSLEDLNTVEAISRFKLQQTALDAAQQSFAQVQNLSLFRYL